MNTHKFSLKLISPAFIAGADKNSPEMRASSIRGQLRYWLRAIIGAETTDLDELHKRESAVFGSTNMGSAVSVRVYPRNKIPDDKYDMLPHKSNARDKSPQWALSPERAWDLELVTRPGVPMPEDALKALKVWSLLGGIGRRSRRMFGAVEIKPKTDEDIDWYGIPESPDELAETIRAVLAGVIHDTPMTSIPLFPTLNSNQSWVIVGRNGYGTYEEVVIDLFKHLLRIPEFLKKEQTFGGIRPRRSSPLIIAQVRRVGKDSYYPVLTAIKSKPDKDSNIDWQHLKKFMQGAESYFNGVTKWGGW